MMKINNKNLKELILSGKHLKQNKKGRSIRIRIETWHNSELKYKDD